MAANQPGPLVKKDYIYNTPRQEWPLGREGSDFRWPVYKTELCVCCCNDERSTGQIETRQAAVVVRSQLSMSGRRRSAPSGRERLEHVAGEAELRQAPPAGIFFCAECGEVLSTRDEFKTHQVRYRDPDTLLLCIADCLNTGLQSQRQFPTMSTAQLSLLCHLQETVHQAHNLAQSDEEEDEYSDAEESAAAAAASSASQAADAHSKAPCASGQRNRSRNRSRKGSGQATSSELPAKREPEVLPSIAQHAMQQADRHAGQQDSAESSTAAGSTSSKRVRGPRARRASKPAAGSDSPADPPVTVGDPPVAQPNGLHVDDALNAAKHAVQELWVPRRKPTPGMVWY